ncbi:ATP-binding protein [Helicovermis profundi]|uniref:histidine kinase n=1 Tax=Helicovermis profundi TaxID=3065157 RepID=A0AAU9EMT8_9FIRM|nr:hypothetical protein HLPR_09270 [Clostridia bacterium S502]
MIKSKFSIKSIIFIPIISVLLSILIIFFIFIRSNYNWISNEEGTKLATLLNENIQNHLEKLLLDPQFIGSILSQNINTLYDENNDNLSLLEKNLLTFYTKILKKDNQINAISFGNEKGNYIGFRYNKTSNSFSLMLKDIRTNYNLNIYDNSTIKSKINASYKNYDPRIRPWYLPVKESLKQKWSDVYVNQDEIESYTISSLTPVFDHKNNFLGSISIDINLNEIDKFLNNNLKKSMGTIYIADKNWNLISNSNDASMSNNLKTKSTLPKLTLVSESDNILIKNSYTFLKSNDIKNKKIYKININNNPYFILYNDLDILSNLKWKVVIIIPEKNLLGSLKNKTNYSIIAMLVIFFIGSLATYFLLIKVTNPILKSSELATNIADGNWHLSTDFKENNILEINELNIALHSMTKKLKKSFDDITTSKNKYRYLVENIDNMIYSMSVEGIMLAINKPFEKILKRDRKEVIGTHYKTLFDKYDDALKMEAFFNKALDTKKMTSYNYDFIDENTRKFVRISLIPILDDEKNIIMVIGSNYDITKLINTQLKLEELHKNEKDKLEKMLDDKTKELETTMKELLEKEKLASLGSLVSGVAHEINTPLGVSITTASFIEDIITKNKKLTNSGKLSKSSFFQFLNNLDESIKILSINLLKAAELVNSFKKISVNQSHDEKTNFDLCKYTHEIVLSLKHEYKNTNHKINIDCDSSIIINSFPGAFSQILTNLIINTLKHGFSNKTNGNINIKIYKENHNIIISYSDDGYGIEKKVLPKIFNPFFTTNRNTGNSGLGLNIVYNIVTGKLKGKINCTSIPNKKTTFTIEFPFE